jgi:hypothetical protein
MIAVVIMWLAFAGVVGWAANEQGRNPAMWVVLSLLLSPLIGFIALIAAGESTGSSKANSGSQSPQVKAKQAETYRVCKRVGEKKFPSDTAQCPHCGDVIHVKDETHPRID